MGEQHDNKLKRKVMLTGARPFWDNQLERLFVKEDWSLSQILCKPPK